MAPVIDVALPLLVVIVMTIVGLELRGADFLRVREYPVLVPAIVVGQWIALTAVAGLVGLLPGLPQAVAAGALLVAAAPVATLSNYYTHLAAGHLALAVTVTAVSNALAFLATPLVAAIGFRLFLGEAAAVELPLARAAQQTFVGLLLPLAAGMAIRHRAPQWTQRWRTRVQLLGMLAIAAVFGLIVVDQYAAIRDGFGALLGAALLFTGAMLAIGALAAAIAPAADRRALLWGFPARNVAVATLIAATTIGQAAMALFAAVLFATQIALFVPLGRWLGARRDRR
jgi:bile acid:Na+ symporter, BASS family